MILEEKKWNQLGIIGYGSHIDAKKSPSAVQRVRLFRKYGMRCIIVPQHFKGKQKRLFDRELALYLCGFAIDNGAYTCHLHKTEFPEERFLELCNLFGNGADWIAIPDVVADGKKTLDILPIWLDKIKKHTSNTNLLLVWQDGMTLEDITPFLKQGIGVFIGGTTEGKLKNMYWICKICKKYKVLCHVGRVNTYKRIKLCKNAGAISFDGSGWSRFICTMMHLEKIITERQLSLFKQNLDKDIIQTWIKTPKQREKVLLPNEKQAHKYLLDIAKINCNGVGLPKGSNKQQYPILYRTT
jgi:hypothetical protein